jgi:ankyrin repeat protein
LDIGGGFLLPAAGLVAAAGVAAAAAAGADLGADPPKEKLIADCDAAGSFGQTALYRASYHGHLAVLEELLRAGADANKPDVDGLTPLATALSRGNAAVAARRTARARRA